MGQARERVCRTVRWPTISIPLPDGSAEVIFLDYFGPLRTTSCRDKYMFLFTDRLSRRAAMFPVSASEFFTLGTGNTIVENYIPRW